MTLHFKKFITQNRKGTIRQLSFIIYIFNKGIFSEICLSFSSYFQVSDMKNSFFNITLR